MQSATILVAVVVSFAVSVEAKVHDMKDYGADATDTEGFVNRAALLHAFGNATDGDTVTVAAGEVYNVLGGVVVEGKQITFSMQGTLILVANFTTWPVEGNRYLTFIHFFNSSVNVTGSGTGYFEGKGISWWNKWIIDPPAANKPYLLQFYNCSNMHITGFSAHNSPGAYIVIDDSINIEIFDIDIETDRKAKQEIRDRASKMTNLTVQPEDLNTGGINPSGRYIHVHDLRINNDDDSIAVKPLNEQSIQGPCTEHLLFERLTLIGYGASIGSVPPNEYRHCVNNITFLDIDMPETGKGIYIKSNPHCGVSKTCQLSNILYQNITITNPSWWAIWVGPQQQHEPGKKLDEKCALDYPIDEHCPTQGCADFRSIVLKDVTITNPRYSPGVFLGNVTNPMEITLDNVNVHGGDIFPFGHDYKCENVNMTVINSNPVPKCT